VTDLVGSADIRLRETRAHEGSQARAWEELAYQLRLPVVEATSRVGGLALLMLGVVRFGGCSRESVGPDTARKPTRSRRRAGPAP